MKQADQISTSALVFAQLGAELPALARSCETAWRLTRADGYPTQSLAGSSGPSSITHEFMERCNDCNGAGFVPVPGRGDLGVDPCETCQGNGMIQVELSVPQHSDPVGELVISPVEANPARAALLRAVSLLRQAEKLGEQARAVLWDAVNRPVEPPDEDDPDKDLWCSVCVKAKVMSPTYSIECIHPSEQVGRARCSDCAGWAHSALLDDRLPRERPRSLILLQASGGRLTTKAVEQATGVQVG